MPKWLESVAYFACLICMQQMIKNLFKCYYVRGKTIEQHIIDYRAPTIWILLRDGFTVWICSCGGIIVLALWLKTLGEIF